VYKRQVLVLAPLAIPVGLLAALAVRLDGKPVIFRQTRIGKGGRPFSLLKFRTMDPFADAYATSPTDDSDPRVTKVGGFIRRIGLDELPQLLNVLLGDMSLVGPRPEMPQIVAGYSRVERSRLSVRPGLTGIWQLSPERSAAIHENLDYDLYYVNRKSLTLDFLILGETVAFALRAMVRSIGLWLTGLRAARPHRQPGPAPRRMNGFRRGDDSADGFVFVALDQRQRPHEPPTWTSIVPRIRPLGESHRVKLLVARSNRDRLAELAPQSREHANGGGVEYVPYVKEAVKQLSSQADCVVTDLRHVADWAAVAGVPTFLVDGGELRTSSEVRGQRGALVILVGSVLGDGDAGDAATA
jgi:lipopolysaccharide/colanic/teichoic acid biosynthesis glycosyltransferase